MVTRWEKIAFASTAALNGSDAANTNDTRNIWVINADGSQAKALTQLTALNIDCFDPAWSPDGSKIVFGSTRALDGTDTNTTNAVENIWVMNADGSQATPLTKITAANGDSFSAAWSPDGSKILFVSERALDLSDAANTNSTDNIWVMNADGSNPTALTQVTAASAHSFGPAWSPDGSKIAFGSQRALDGSNAANTNNLENTWVMNADGSHATALTQLTAASAGSFGPFLWSPDGSKVLFASRRALDGSDASNPTFNIWTVNPDGSHATALTQLTTSGADSTQPAQP